MGLFDFVKQGDVKSKTPREGFFFSGSATGLFRLHGTSLWSEKSPAGKPIPGRSRYKFLFEVPGFDMDANLLVNTQTVKGGPAQNRPAVAGEKLTVLIKEESDGFQKYGDAQRLVLFAASCGAVRVEDGVVATLDGDSDSEALSKYLDEWYSDSTAYTGTWFFGQIRTKPSKKDDGNGFANLDAVPLSDEQVGTMLTAASGATDEDGFNAFLAENGIEGEDASAKAREYLRTLKDEAAIGRILEAFHLFPAQRP